MNSLRILSTSLVFTLSLMLTQITPAQAADPKTKTSLKGDKKMSNTVIIETSEGKIEVELNQEKAPISTANFLKYTDEHFYDGTIFHRVIKDFMVQGGGFDSKMEQKKTHDQIKNEAANGLKNDKYTVAMARTNVVDSATAQFFINTKDNGFLNYKDQNNYGYAVFGKVVAGNDVVDKINTVMTTTKSGMSDVPEKTVTIKSVTRK
jgi:cyclophilin family peptidyl-prolyl cis-trans isomerase